jgi:hypothetical protein
VKQFVSSRKNFICINTWPVKSWTFAALSILLTAYASVQAADLPPPPSVTITSRTNEGNVVHLKGVLEGTSLKSGGIYENGRCVKAFTLAPTVGRERVELDLAIGDPPPDTEIHVVDSDGRTASAPVLDTDEAAAFTAPAVAAGGLAPPAIPESSAPVGGNDVAEIPTHGPPLPSPSKRHTIGGRLADVHINIFSITETSPAPPTYRISGQIEGTGVAHAGIYVDGRLVEPLPVKVGVSSASFDQTFVMNGHAASIRAYGLGSQFVENSLDLSSDLPTQMTAEEAAPAAPMMLAPPPSVPGIGVEITSVQPIGAKQYQVNGMISGRELASAGLYQNGVLAQDIALGGGGITINGSGLSDLLGGIIPSRAKSVNFTVRYNPAQGPAAIRAYARNGQYTEQPIFMRGLHP